MAELKHYQQHPDGSVTVHKPSVNGQAPPAYYNVTFQGDDPDSGGNERVDDVLRATETPIISLAASDESMQDGQAIQGLSSTVFSSRTAVLEDGFGEDSEDEPADAYTRCVARVQDAVYGFFTGNAVTLWKVFYIVLLVLYVAYFIGAMTYKFGDEGSLRLLVVTLVVAAYLLFRFMSYILRRHGYNGVGSSQCMVSLSAFAAKIRLDVILAVAVTLFAIVFVIVEVGRHKPERLISAGGMAAFLLLFYVFSYNPAKVRWRPVVWGMLLQIIFALVILRTSWGYDSFAYLGDRISEFLTYTDAGSKFVFGDLYTNHFFAFKVLPVVVFFSTFVSMLYYIGFMQFIIRNVGRFLAFCLDTSPAESLNAAGNIFIGQSEAPLLIRPFIADMTRSELHAVLTGGFATIAGSVMAAYMQYGDRAKHHRSSV